VLVSSAFHIPHSAFDQPPEICDFELADDLRRARRLLRIDVAHGGCEPSGLATLLAGESGRESKGRRRDPRRPARASFAARLWGGLTWLLVCVGGMGLTFGAGLLVCTQLLPTDRAEKLGELWNWGLLTTLAGQFFLFLGVGLRRSSGLGFAPSGASRAKRRLPKRRMPPASQAVRPSAPPWSASCDAALGVSIDSPQRV
jgi:hypothetical protein